MTQKANPVTLTLKIAAKPPPLPSEPFEPERRRRLSIRRLYDFRRQRRYKKWRPKGRHTFPAGTVSQPIGKPFNGQAKGLLWLTWRSYAGPPQSIYLPRAKALNPPVRRSRSQAEPLAPRAKGPAAPSTLAAKPRQPSSPSGLVPFPSFFFSMLQYRQL